MFRSPLYRTLLRSASLRGTHLVRGMFFENEVDSVTNVQAAIFFALLIGVGDITNIHRNTLLFKDRWSSYKAVKWKLSYFGRIIDKLSH
jgi:hypothetical protein